MKIGEILLNREHHSVRIGSGGDITWLIDGAPHRDESGGPARIYVNGYKEWWFDGMRHRVYGPAIECERTGLTYWYLNGIGLSKEGHRIRVALRYSK